MRTNKTMTTPPQSNDFEQEISNPIVKPKNIQIGESPERNLVWLKIYGVIEEPSEYIEEISKLEKLYEKYDVLEITLNSPGGSLNTTVDLASIINKFSYVITIGKGEIASAAFMLWTMGDIKVVTDYSMYMAHRESYGMYGKTSEHKATADIFGRVYEEMFEDCFGDILTETEKQIADRSETWISYKDLLQRKGVISFDEYITPSNPYTIIEMYSTKDGKMFMWDDETDTYRSLSIKFGDELILDMTGHLYGISPITKIAKIQKVESVNKRAEKPTVDKKSKNKIVKSKEKDTLQGK